MAAQRAEPDNETFENKKIQLFRGCLKRNKQYLDGVLSEISNSLWMAQAKYAIVSGCSGEINNSMMMFQAKNTIISRMSQTK
eukprot:1634-Pyramimonas_sp.AAC.1